jgi:hypothetical protein
VRFTVAVAAFLALLTGLWRALTTGIGWAVDGRTWMHRQLRWILPTVAAALVALALDSWAHLLVLVVLACFVPWAILIGRRHGDRLQSDPWYLLRHERTAVVCLIVAMCAGLAIGDEADRPSGLNAVWVTPVEGSAFGAITLGERNGLNVFIKITEDAKVIEDGEIAMPPAQLQRVEHMYTLHGAPNHRPLVKRLYEWLGQPSPSLRS